MSEEYQQRVEEEYSQLKERAERLNHFIGFSPLFDKVEADEQERMKVQLDIMWQYVEILEERIKNFK